MERVVAEHVDAAHVGERRDRERGQALEQFLELRRRRERVTDRGEQVGVALAAGLLGDILDDEDGARDPLVLVAHRQRARAHLPPLAVIPEHEGLFADHGLAPAQRARQRKVTGRVGLAVEAVQREPLVAIDVDVGRPEDRLREPVRERDLSRRRLHEHERGGHLVENSLQSGPFFGEELRERLGEAARLVLRRARPRSQHRMRRDVGDGVEEPAFLVVEVVRRAQQHREEPEVLPAAHERDDGPRLRAGQGAHLLGVGSARGVRVGGMPEAGLGIGGCGALVDPGHSDGGQCLVGVAGCVHDRDLAVFGSQRDEGRIGRDRLDDGVDHSRRDRRIVVRVVHDVGDAMEHPHAQDAGLRHVARRVFRLEQRMTVEGNCTQIGKDLGRRSLRVAEAMRLGPADAEHTDDPVRNDQWEGDRCHDL